MESLHARTAGPSDGPVCLLVHGYPESGAIYDGVLPAVADAGFRALAPDLPGYGDSPLEGDGTWAHHVAALDAFHAEHDLGAVVLVVHDWGGIIALRWACDHPEKVRALVISDTGFFADGEWHGMAVAMRTPGTGEELMENFDRDGFGGVIRMVLPGATDEQLDQHFKAFSTPERRAAQLALYRSGDFAELEPYDGKLAALRVPTLILWGSEDAFAPVAGAHRFAKEIPGAQLEVIEGANHFVWEEEPERCAAALGAFLRGLR